ncbi:MAG: SulP family inorganic anion transporter [Cyclobacteriaceae bacterium]|nr:SulP family inorganic anion transporter [Cyclobacteriaceae bacterium]
MNLFNNFKKDLPASIVVLFVAIPLCLGIALASGAPLLSGIIAGIIGGVLVGSLSGSSLGVSGPAAGLAVIVLNSITELGGFETFLLSVVIAGVIQIILGVVKAGVIGYYFPSAVIKGMLTGIGIVIIFKQIPHAFGYDADFEGEFSFLQPDGHTTFSELYYMLDRITPSAILIAALGLVIILVWDNILSKKHTFFKLLQGPIVAVVAGIFYQVLMKNYWPSMALGNQHLVNVPVSGSFSDFLNLFTLPDFSQILNPQVYVVGITIAVVASLETLLSVEATDKLDPHKRVTPTNQELKAQGIGNVVSGLIGGLPITQVIVRSSANVQSGGQTKLSTILHGILLVLVVVIIPKVLNMIPLAVLASILIVVGFKLAKPSLFINMYKLGKDQFYPFVLTVIVLVFTDLLTGIGVGLLIGVIIILRRNFKNSHFLHLEDKLEQDKHHKIRITLSEEVTFLNKAAILKELNDIKPDSEVTIDMSKSFSIDYDVLEIIDNFTQVAEEKNIKVTLIGRGEEVTADY